MHTVSYSGFADPDLFHGVSLQGAGDQRALTERKGKKTGADGSKDKAGHGSRAASAQLHRSSPIVRLVGWESLQLPGDTVASPAGSKWEREFSGVYHEDAGPSRAKSASRSLGAHS